MADTTSRKPAKKVAKKAAKAPAKKTAKKATGKVAGTTAKKTARPKLLSGGNPQIPKGYGEAPVRAYIDAMPGWKREVGERIDALVTRAVPGVHKAIKWNSPMYGMEDDVWFLSLHCFTNYIKVAFFRGTSLRPPPPEESKTKGTRYFHIRQDDPFDEARFTDWVKQASRLPGERM